MEKMHRNVLPNLNQAVHRVQRVPQTETQGRCEQLPAGSVVVMPEAEEFDVEIKDADIRKDTYSLIGSRWSVR